MSYTQTTLTVLRSKAGSLLQKLYSEFGLVKTELDAMATAVDTSKIKYADLTPGVGTTSALATTGADLADGTGGTTYGVFVAGQAITILGMVSSLTEDYARDTSDAKIEIMDNAAVPVTKVTYTLPSAGRAAKSIVTTAPASAALAAGDILNLKITSTGSSTGTGHAKVSLKYSID